MTSDRTSEQQELTPSSLTALSDDGMLHAVAWYDSPLGGSGGISRTPEQQAAYDRKVDQIATARPPKLVAGPFSYHRPVVVHDSTGDK